MSSQAFTFRAGVCEYNEESRLCTPIACQGEIEIKPHEEEELGFWELEWRPIEKPVAKDLSVISLILIPGETVWAPIKSSKNGRVFALVFSSNQRYLFWLQEKNGRSLALNELSEKDEKIFDKMAKILNRNEDEDADGDANAVEEADNDVEMKDS
ncbi:hypothetical protein HG535_0B06920 [Zygotorulaspora mrakii]|uniref:Pru domain-containing protein n=1 Tax=Zygotorulaspora mrakii TaxID=42260 RepID=A0A7H9AZJ1_ZYGMR|nr:uncharacterized protein HG535_0B06920 [Zygotorulaspora mrakii]QLG71646.1 hypothetical protein HG535_0B06920 [Zygotorulaspora mrakii]